MRLTVHFDDGSAQERERAFLLPVADEERVVRALDRLAGRDALAGAGRRPWP